MHYIALFDFNSLLVADPGGGGVVGALTPYSKGVCANVVAPEKNVCANLNPKNSRYRLS